MKLFAVVKQYGQAALDRLSRLFTFFPPCKQSNDTFGWTWVLDGAAVRVIYQTLQEDSTFGEALPELADQLIQDGNKVAGQIVHRLLDQLKGPQLWLMDGGLVEWARDDSTGQFVGLGSPRHAFYPNAWNPIADTVRPLAAGQWLYYFGMRVVYKPSRAATADSSVALW